MIQQRFDRETAPSRRWHYRRRYQALLQEVIDDMSRIQDEVERYVAPEVEASREDAEAESARRRPGQTEKSL